MKQRLILISGLLCSMTGSAFAQTPAAPAAAPVPSIDQPLTDKELMQQIDALGKGDPLSALPRGVDPAAKAAGKDGKKTNNGTTEITSKEASFDQKTHTAVFLKEVYVENPEFMLSCDKLTAFMKNDQKDAAGKPGATSGAKPAATPARAAAASQSPGAGGKSRVSTATSGNATSAERAAAVTNDKAGKAPGNSGGLEKAIAEGKVVITQDKVDADGTISHNVGRSKRAVYEASTGNITLTGRPEVEQGINTCVALAEETIMILNRAGQMTSIGPSKVVIRDSGGSPTSGPSASTSSTSTVTANAR